MLRDKVEKLQFFFFFFFLYACIFSIYIYIYIYINYLVVVTLLIFSKRNDIFTTFLQQILNGKLLLVVIIRAKK